ncbi:zinc finger protein 892-like isoform X1 [Uranotaenia lowii]|uniref:zinc finger protein 892-like isoform X1 n=1 Tax=Uranotaenia lowii TaxID=190385 RepID=UPI00247ADC88|nr:zinc finger protein 892-like isoform X1 [Uranotaenia lowii]
MPRKSKDNSNKKSAMETVVLECAEIKNEPPDGFSYEEPEMSFCEYRLKCNHVSVQTSRKIGLRDRAVQVDSLPRPKERSLDVEAVGVGIQDEALVAKGSVQIQCRMCLRRMSRARLSFLMFPQNSRILNAIGIKIYLGDAYPFICRICNALIDLIFDFRKACHRARDLLVQERKSVDDDGWDDAENLNVVANCKLIVDRHKQKIDKAYDEILTKRHETLIKPKIHDSVSTPNDHAQKESKKLELEPIYPINCLNKDSEIGTEDAIQSVDQNESNLVCSSPDSRSSDHFNAEISNIGDKKRISSPVSHLEVSREKTKRTRIVTKPYRKRVKVEAENEYESAQKTHKARKTATDPNRKRGALCDFCGTWIEYHSMESHKNQHLGVRPYSCQHEGCEQAFHSRNLLMKHIRRHHRDDGPEYQTCEICDQRIKGPKGALTKHQKIHSEAKNYVCSVCGKGFTTPGYLRQHSVIHSDDMPFACGVCGRRFNNRYNMRTHERKHVQRGESFICDPNDPGDLSQSNSTTNAAPVSSLGSQFPSSTSLETGQHYQYQQPIQPP